MINLIESDTRGLNTSYTSVFVSYWDTNSCPLVILLYIKILQEIKAVRKSWMEPSLKKQCLFFHILKNGLRYWIISIEKSLIIRLLNIIQLNKITSHTVVQGF